jgi:hypothetical protein
MDPSAREQSRQGLPPEYIKNFSDLTLMSTPLRRRTRPSLGAIFFQLLGLVHAQVDLIHQEGIVIRGAVTVGDVVKSYRQLFGPGIIDAYRIESKIANYPRIVVERRVLDEINANERLWVHDREDELKAVGGLLRQDEKDGCLYIDYLRVIRDQCEGTEFDEFVHKHDVFIDTCL